MFPSIVIALVALWLIAAALIFPSKATPSNIVFGVIIIIIDIIQMVLINKRKKEK
ncbi:MAG: hypothetical protein ACP5FK_01660 [bacterium]